MNGQDTTAPVWKLKDLSWLLDAFAARVGHNVRAVLASQDGLLASATGPLSDDDRARLCASAAGLLSLGRATVQAASGDPAGGDVQQMIIEHPACLVFVMAAGAGSLLTVATDPQADPGRVGHEMTELIQRVGEHLTTPARTLPEDQ